MVPILHAAAIVMAGATSVALTAQAFLHLAARRATRCAAARRADTSGAWLRGTMREALLSLRVALTCARRTPVPAGDGASLVVLVHGFASSPATLSVLARRLRRSGWRVATPRLGRWWRDVADGTTRLAAHLEQLRRDHDPTDVVLVAHGIGGLAARLLLQEEARWPAVRRLITLGTPHGGTIACPWLRIGPWRYDVRPGSALLRALGAPLPPSVEAIAIASPEDTLVLPAERAGWREACNISVRESGHLDLVFAARVFDLIAENLAPPGDHAG